MRATDPADATAREAPLTGEPQPVDNSTTGQSTAGCYGWPRTCEHYDDLACMLAEKETDVAFQRYFTRAGRRHDQGHGMPASVKISGRRRGW